MYKKKEPHLNARTETKQLIHKLIFKTRKGWLSEGFQNQSGAQKRYQIFPKLLEMERWTNRERQKLRGITCWTNYSQLSLSHKYSVSLKHFLWMLFLKNICRTNQRPKPLLQSRYGTRAIHESICSQSSQDAIAGKGEGQWHLRLVHKGKNLSSSDSVDTAQQWVGPSEGSGQTRAPFLCTEKLHRKVNYTANWAFTATY